MSHTPSEHDTPIQAEANAKPSAGGTRRRLLQGALSATPVLLTLASRPAYATCKQPSGFSVSGNLSRPADFSCNGSTMGKKPSEWATGVGWPSAPTPPCNSGTTKVKDIFGGSDATLLQAKLIGGSEIEKYVIAAYLNSRTSRTPNNPTEVVKMWNGKHGAYSPVPGVTWSTAQLLAYLKHTTGEL